MRVAGWTVKGGRRKADGLGTSRKRFTRIWAERGVAETERLWKLNVWVGDATAGLEKGPRERKGDRGRGSLRAMAVTRQHRRTDDFSGREGGAASRDGREAVVGRGRAHSRQAELEAEREMDRRRPAARTRARAASPGV